MDRDADGNIIPFMGNLSRFGRLSSDINLALYNLEKDRNDRSEYPIYHGRYCYRWSDEIDRLVIVQIINEYDDFPKLGPIQEMCEFPRDDFLFLWIDATTQPRVSLVKIHP